ncbi:NUDIX hydrolase [Methylocystis sp. S23]|jgi:8-oxo-dGTP pyrophosphatase MutT (NUDIX family)
MKKKAPKSPKQDASSGAPRTQYAALPWRIDAETGVEICLVTSRDTKRWVIPKGWPMKGRKPHIVAAIEATQEAGLQGKIEKAKLGEFEYEKRLQGGAAVDCRVEVFPLRVERQRKKWPERNQRVTYWFPYAIAANQVDEPQLRELILAFGSAVSRTIDPA